MLDWNDLRVVLAIAEHGSLSRAARALGIHQTTCGRRLDEAERALGVALFVRGRRGLAQTPATGRVFGTLRELARSLGAIERDLGADRRRATVRIAVTETTAQLLAEHLFPTLRRTHPDLTIELVPANVVADLAGGEADLAVRFVRPDDPDLIKRRIGWVRYGLYAASTYLARRRAEQPQLAGDHVVWPSRELARGPEATWLEHHASAARVTVRSSSLLALAAAAEHGAGLAVLPTNVARIHRGLVAVRELPEVPRREVWLAMHRSVRRVEALRIVADAVHDALVAVSR